MSGAGERGEATRTLVREWYEVRNEYPGLETWTECPGASRAQAISVVRQKRKAGYRSTLIRVRRYRIERQKGAGHG